MTSLRVEITEEGPDLVLEAGDLVLDHTLAPLALVSIFTDARAGDDVTPPDLTDDRRGWWGEEQGDPFGSLLWLLSREKLLQATAARAANYVREALDWLLRDELAGELAVEGSIGEGYLDLRARITRGDAARGASVWEATRAAAFNLGGARVRLLFD